MFFNGKYVDYSEKKAAKIQQQVNKEDYLGAEFKAGIDPMKQINSENALLEYGIDSLFEYERPEVVDRKTRYMYYREMDTMEFIHRGLEIVADDGSQDNEEGNRIKIYSDDEETKKILEELFLERLDMNNDLWSVIFDTAKMGDNFFEVIPDNYDNPKKVVYLRYLEPEKVERIEKNGRLIYFKYKSTNRFHEVNRTSFAVEPKKMEIEYRLQPWQVIHFTILPDRDAHPYGASLLKPGVRTYRRLSLLEDVILVYRISRAPERRVFYVDVGNLNVVEAKKFIRKIKDQYRTQSFIDEDGNINKRANVLSITSDIFVPIREGGLGTKIETLQGGEGLKTIDDLDYFKNKILRTMNIPFSYLGDEADRSKGTLTQQDIKFSRFIERIQMQVVKGLSKVAALELFFNKKRKENLNDFRIELTPPSNIKEITEIDLINQRMGLLGTIKGLDIFSTDWMLKKILKMSDKEIADILLQKALEAKKAEAGVIGGAPIPGMEGVPAEGLPAEMPPTETPPAEGAPIPEAPPVESTLIKALGKDFLLENKEDFFKLIKLLEDSNKPKLLTEDIKYSRQNLFEAAARIIKAPVRKHKPFKTENIKKQFITNEFGGLLFENSADGQRAIKLYEVKEEMPNNYEFKENVSYIRD